MGLTKRIWPGLDELKTDIYFSRSEVSGKF
jgi:hypothetical protein